MGIQLGGPVPPAVERLSPSLRFLLFSGVFILVSVSFLLGGCQAVDGSLQTLRAFFRGEGDKGVRELAEADEAPPPRFSGLPSGQHLPDDALADDPSVSVQTGAFAAQDTVESLLTGNGLTSAQVHELVSAAPPDHPLSRVGEGRRYEVALGKDGLRRLVLQLDEERRLRIYRTRKGGLRVQTERIPYDLQVVRLRGKIQGSLFETIAKAGGSPSVAMSVADIFGFVVDFHKELQEGDQIDALIERRSLEGKAGGFGRILAAKLTVRGKERAAFLFEPTGDYYSGEGETLRRAFLRSPLRYTRITSRFSHARFHPILMRTRPHYGVDYAAPMGTPVQAVAEGVVAWAGPRGEAGNMVRILHPGWYETSYFHLSRFGGGIRAGRKVRQGEVIGYVGATGLATGPHLDYRITHRGAPIDPLTAALPSGWPLPAPQRAEFRRAVQQREAEWAQAPGLESADAVASAAAKEQPLF